MTSTERAKTAYDTFRSGFDDQSIVPAWNDAPSWVRDAVLVAYLQGTLDGRAKQTQVLDHQLAVSSHAGGHSPQTLLPAQSLRK